jgi:hypothetical protein
MRDSSAFRWGVDDLDRSTSGEGRVPLRAKPVIRRGAARWVESDGAFRATIGGWAVTVAMSPGGAVDARGEPRAPTWEWSAFGRARNEPPRVLGCRGFAAREAAQHDAELSLARLA